MNRLQQTVRLTDLRAFLALGQVIPARPATELIAVHWYPVGSHWATPAQRQTSLDRRLARESRRNARVGKEGTMRGIELFAINLVAAHAYKTRARGLKRLKMP